MKTGFKTLGAVLAVIVFGALLTGCRGEKAYNSQAIGGAVKLFAVTYLNEPNGAGYAVVPVKRDFKERQFVNVVADLNKDGKWKNYSVKGKVQEEWVVRNVAVVASTAEPFSFSFVFNDADAPSRKDLKLRVVLTEKPIKASDATVGWDGTVPKGAAAARDVTVAEVGVDEFGDIWSPDPTGLTEKYPDKPAPAAASDSTPDGGYYGAPEAAYAATPEDITFHRDGVPDIDQRRNECVPTSTANSLIWLAEKYDFKDKMPETADQVIQELKNDMNWGERWDAAKRRHVGGVNVLSDFLNGKKKFIDRHHLPIETHQIGDRFDSGFFEKIVVELKKGQDVEISLEYKKDGERIGGHMVTVVGAQTYTDPDDGSVVKFLAFHDPASRPGPSTDIYPVFLTKVYGYRYSPGKTKDGYEIHIRFAFAESPVEIPPAEGAPPREAPPEDAPPADGTPPDGEPRTGEEPAAEEEPSSTRERSPGDEPVSVPPAKPTTIKADNSVSCRITVTWKDCSNDEDGFEIERKGLYEKDWKVVHTTVPDTTTWTNSGYDNPPMQGGATYGYRIRAYKVVDSRRLYSEYTDIVWAKKR
ncbi:MAG: hypothetical protein AB1500_11765 [Bacillota bacterium]